jgi:hypothetical protein
MSVTYPACHPNEKPSDLHFVKPAFGMRIPRGVGIAIGIVLPAALFLSCVLFIVWACVADWWHRRKSYQQVPPRAAVLEEGTSSNGVPPPSAAVAIDVPSNSHAGKIDTVD